MRGAITPHVAELDAVLARVKAHPKMDGLDLVPRVTCAKKYEWTEPTWRALDDGRALPPPAVAFHVVALRRGRWAVTELRLAPDLVLVVHRGDGRLIAGHVRSATYVAASLSSIVWRPDGGRYSRAILIVPDMLPEEDFRRLRVMLRYARNAEVQDTPLSHP